MGLTKAQRRARRERVLEQLRVAACDTRHPVTLTLQRGRKRPRVTGHVAYIATTGSFVLLRRPDVPADPTIGERERDPLHVPVDVIRAVNREDRRC